MKKDVYIITGILALIISGFLFAYMKFQKKEAPLPIESSEVDYKVDQQTLMGDGNPSLGPIMAKVVVVEFLDPECEACRAFHPRVKKVLAEYDGKIRYLVRHMPYHHNSANAIKALEAALEQGKYWELLDLLFEKQSEWGEKSTDQKELLFKYAKSLGLDMNKFKTDFESEAFAARVEKDKADANRVGIRGTPSFFINGTPLVELGEEPLRQAIIAMLEKGT